MRSITSTPSRAPATSTAAATSMCASVGCASACQRRSSRSTSCCPCSCPNHLGRFSRDWRRLLILWRQLVAPPLRTPAMRPTLAPRSATHEARAPALALARFCAPHWPRLAPGRAAPPESNSSCGGGLRARRRAGVRVGSPDVLSLACPASELAAAPAACLPWRRWHCCSLLSPVPPPGALPDVGALEQA